MRLSRTFPLALAAALCAGPVLAEDTSVNEPIGTGTQNWVKLQTGGTAASPVARPMPGDVADKTYTRYAESFTHPIPEKFEREQIVKESGGN